MAVLLDSLLINFALLKQDEICKIIKIITIIRIL